MLVGVAVGYLALVLFIPTLNVFVQVSIVVNIMREWLHVHDQINTKGLTGTIA